MVAGWVFLLAVPTAFASRAANRSQAQPISSSVQSLKSMSLEQLGNVRVTVLNKQPREVWRTPAAVYVLTHEDIERSGATSIPELLRLVPGLQVSRVQSGQWAVGIRGFGDQFSKNLLVLIDGRSVYTPLFEGVYWDVQDLVLEDIAQIEVILGPGAAIWGPNAVNGVINIITKPANSTRGAMVSVKGGGAVDRFIGAARIGFQPVRNFQFRVYAKGFNRGPELNPRHSLYDRWRQERGGFRAGWQPTRRDRWMFEGAVYQGKTGAQTAIGKFFPPEQFVSNQQQAVSGGNLVARWNRRLRGSNLRLQAYFDRTNRRTSQFTETRNTFDLDFMDQISSFRRQDISLGAQFRESPSHFIQTVSTVNFEPHRQNNWIYSLFLQDRFALVPDRLFLTLGSKFEDDSFSGWGVEPSARLLWNPSSHAAVWASVSRALRVPGRLDRDLALIGNVTPSPPVFVTILGDPHFRPPVLIGWQAGYRQLIWKSLYLDLAGFHNQYDGLEGIGQVSISVPTDPYPYVSINAPWANSIKGVTDGFEIAPSWKPLSFWEIRGSYSYLHMKLHLAPGFTDADPIAAYEGSSPHRQARLQSVLDLPHGFEADADYRFVSALPAQDVKSYQTGNVRVAWRVSRHYQVEAVGRNLLQPSHREFMGNNGNAVGIRRTFYGGLLWTR